jgi:hypothetical protein
VAVTVVTMIGYAFWVDRIAKKHGLQRRRPAPPTPPVLPPPAPETLRAY